MGNQRSAFHAPIPSAAERVANVVPSPDLLLSAGNQWIFPAAFRGGGSVRAGATLPGRQEMPAFTAP
jgi:hypothetical protein